MKAQRFTKARWTPSTAPARLLMLQRGLTYSRIIATLKERRIRTSITAVREVIVGISRRPDLRAAIAELLGQSAEQLWPDNQTDHAA